MAQTLIQSLTVGPGGASSLDFTGIPNTFTDLMVTLSVRGTGGVNTLRTLVYQFNGSTSGYSAKDLYTYNSSTPASGNYTTLTSNSITGGRVGDGQILDSGTTANSFSSLSWYIPNYASSNQKSWSIDSVGSSNSSMAELSINAGLWTGTAAITSITITPRDNVSFAQYSTASLYGVKKDNILPQPKATGGTILQSGGYWYHTFTASGTFTPTTSLTAEVLAIAGGGGGSVYAGGGGGAGGLLYHSGKSMTAGNYTVTIGAGGGGISNASGRGGSGANTVFDTMTAVGGGGAGGDGYTGLSGGSGGGGSYTSAGGAATQGSSGGATGYGFKGGNSTSSAGNGTGGGGGGAGAAGTNDGPGGNGLNTWAAWAAATGTGVSGYFAGGGAPVGSTAGLGGGGTPGVSGATNTGGGGGGLQTGTSGSGGSGIVIVRYAV